MRRVLLLLVLLLMFAGAASATDYYVATWGDNTTSGNITHPWQNVSYATQQATAGDTIYLFDGTWYNENPLFANSGNATHPITLTAYNGTPTLDGVDRTTYGIETDLQEYVVIDGDHKIVVKNYLCGIRFELSNYSILKNIEVDGNWQGPGEGHAIIQYDQCDHSIIENCTFHDSGRNTIGLAGHREPPNGDGIFMSNITIDNCTIYNSTLHNAIDLYGNIDNVTIKNCVLHNNSAGNIFTHDAPDWWRDITIQDNTIRDSSSTGINNFARSYNILIENNTFLDMDGDNSVYISAVENVTMCNNEFASCVYDIRFSGTDNVTAEGNTIYANSTAWYRFSTSTNATVIDPVGEASIRIDSNSSAELRYTIGSVISANYYGTDSHILPSYYPDHSNTSATMTTSGTGYIRYLVKYNATLKPTNVYLKDVTVNHESDAADDRTHISVNSSVSTNPSWINATMQNASNTYNVSIDGIYSTQVVSDANKIVRYQYTSSWSPHTFEFDWFSAAGFSGAPDPVNIANTTGDTWVRHSWSAGSGNVTDSYNVSVNSVWHNITNAYYNNTGLAAETWSNVTVWAYNNTGGISQNSISQNTQSDAAARTPSDTAANFNTTVGYAIEITTKTDGTNLFSRTPTQADENATSGRMVVKT